MNLEEIKKQFDEILAGMSNEEIILSFKESGCDVTIDPDNETKTFTAYGRREDYFEYDTEEEDN